MPSVSVVIPVYDRVKYLPSMLDNLRKQTHVPEMIVVEDGDDGQTREIAEKYGAGYVQHARLPFPTFQNLPALKNLGIQAASGDLVLLQDAEIVFEETTGIERMVRSLGDNHFRSISALLKELDQNDRWVYENWYSHPTKGCRPGWVFGGGPRLFWKDLLLGIGGYEELFFGYGYDDCFFDLLLKKQGVQTEYVMDAIAQHRWHPRPAFEIVTGHASRSRMRLLEQEIELGLRPAIANWGPYVTVALPAKELQSVLGYTLAIIAGEATFRFVPPYPKGVTEFCNWVQKINNAWDWNWNPDLIEETFQLGALVRNQSKADIHRDYPYLTTSEVDQFYAKSQTDTQWFKWADFLCDAIWAYLRAQQTLTYKSDPNWSPFVQEAYDTHLSWATMAVGLVL